MFVLYNLILNNSFFLLVWLYTLQFKVQNAFSMSKISYPNLFLFFFNIHIKYLLCRNSLKFKYYEFNFNILLILNFKFFYINVKNKFNYIIVGEWRLEGCVIYHIISYKTPKKKKHQKKKIISYIILKIKQRGVETGNNC